MIKYITLIFACFVFTIPNNYPIDGYQNTGIKRLKRLQLTISGELPNPGLPSGAYKSINDIKLNLLSRKKENTENLLIEDAILQKKINTLFPRLDRSYSITILDITNPTNLRYAQQNESRGYQPGSVGKLAVVTGLFHQLAKIYPDSWEKRTDLLKTKFVRAGNWALSDEHTVPIFNTETNKLVKRQVDASDVFSLYEWTDHMLSVSNNGAASVVWREVLLMAAFGDKYPNLTEIEADTYFKNTPKSIITDLSNDVVNIPLRELGITSDEWRLGTFFTRGANQYVGAKGGSIGTPLGLMKWMLQLEQGKIIDEKSSLEIKRLMFMTDRRIRYAQAPQLKDAAVYFKSGSLYKCDRTKGEPCGKYKGNVDNFMNSVAIIEHPDGTNYMVCLMTNVLRKNSASDHMFLAGSIDKAIKS
ncbi:beta-lactamase family protein [Tenacibaculum adriaticum]|uniref:Beta-lactamase family protein n=1 Tax=Tenacibaculum adriaticum TaxID=413713 RepID=A0A5S5DNW3_9FLAO|nr:serine hydrolase [Tenacibaculum adriaticum]TYP97415.1 beta-lactamase family protein [Tenacibaculum adriaticum]